MTWLSVAEQMLYEIGDPARCILPDVVCDFTGVTLEQVEPDRVRVRDAHGTEPTPNFKVSATYPGGYACIGGFVVAGDRAVEKARSQGEAILDKVGRMLAERQMPPFTHTDLKIIGFALSMAPGLTLLSPGRPKPSPLVGLYSFLLAKDEVRVRLEVDGKRVPMAASALSGNGPLASVHRGTGLPSPDGESVEVPLRRIAVARSGDKGNKANIGVIARDRAYLPSIRAALTSERVAERLAHFVRGKVDQFDLPGVHAVNFLLNDALGGGGAASINLDSQGKTYAQLPLDMPVPVPVGLVSAEDRS